jgi:hypothetical protein
MVWEYLQKTPNSTIANRANGVTQLTTDAFGGNVQVGEHVFGLFTAGHNGTRSFNLSDSKNNTGVVDKISSSNEGSYQFYSIVGHCKVDSGKNGTGFQVTLTANGSTDYVEGGAIRAQGGDPNLVTGGSANNSNAANSTSPNTGAFNAGTANNFLNIANLNLDTSSVKTITSNNQWTEIFNDGNGAWATIGSMIKIGNGSQNGTWSLNATCYWVAEGIAFLEAPTVLDYFKKVTVLTG